MHIEIQARDFSVTDALRDYVERRLGFAMSSRAQYIQRIIVRLADVNGPRGGTDKCCHLQIKLPRLADVVIEDTEADLYMAVDRAADRAQRTVSRRLDRQRFKGRTRYVPGKAMSSAYPLSGS